MTKQLFIKPSSLRPWQHCRAVVPPGNPNHGWHIRTSMNGPGVNEALRSVSGSYVGMILGKGNNPGIDGNRTDWTPPCPDFPHYHPSFLDCLGPFSGANPLSPTPNRSPVCATTPALGLFHHVACAPRHSTLFSEFGLTPPQGQILPLYACAPYPHAFSVFSPAMWSPEKILQIRSRLGLPNALWTFPVCES